MSFTDLDAGSTRKEAFAGSTRNKPVSLCGSLSCVRVHEPIDLAETVLKRNQGWDRARIDAVLASGERTVVNLDAPLPVHIVYSTAWLAEDGTVRFYVDFYGRDERLYQALFGKPVPWKGG